VVKEKYKKAFTDNQFAMKKLKGDLLL